MLAIISDKLHSIFKEYYNDNKIERYAFSTFIHTFGRDLKFNPHLHIIVTEGGFKKNGIWKKLEYFAWQKFNKSWKMIITEVIKENISITSNIRKILKKLWKESTKAFFNVKGQTLK